MRLLLAAACVAAVAGAGAHAQPASGAEADYLKRIATAAPPQIVEQATVIRMDGAAMQTLRKGSNAWTCMVANDVPMCLDPNAMEWAHAWQTHGPATEKTGFIYMLAGDQGASNTDPWAREKAADNHWVVTGPHVMIVGGAAKAMAGYPRSADPDVSRPYVMWPGTPHEHLMLPVR